ncbi:ATP-binding protein [Thiococcus pfennigii]|uniref:ATP-binding protein n=1 Tax=Thiococcus pfennigii TaxID=1057 RepID=UPI0030B89023|nr:PAS domain-containing sensor histidine kinase [Thiococcus pfennigii]MBK1731226.1 PAS domain-containing sensor histidine kinase [Thiococcus pfennigii]
MKTFTVKPFLFRLLRPLPMPVIAILIGLLTGLAVWAVLDQVQGRMISKIANRELKTQLSLRSREGLIRFDRYVASYAATTRLLANHRRLAEHLDPIVWLPNEPFETRLYRDAKPAWLADSFARYELPTPSHILLLDGTGALREVYESRGQPLPGELTDKIRRQLTWPDGMRPLLVAVGGLPYLVIGDLIEDSEGFPMGTLVLAVPVDADFLTAAQQVIWPERVLVALVTGSTQRIVTSVDPETLPPGTHLKTWRRDYLITSQPLSQQETGGWDLHFTTFVSHASVDRMARHMRTFEWRQRGLTALIFILVFTAVIYLVSARLNRILKRMSRFAHRALGIAQPGFQRGNNQLLLLEDWIQQFTQLVLKARQELSRHYEHEMRETEALKAAIMEASLDSIVTIDGRGRIVDCNPTAERAFGLRRDRDIGQPFAVRSVAASDLPLFDGLLAESHRAQREGREPHVRGELAALRHDGTTMPVELSIVPIEVDDGTFYTLYMHDITERLEAEREIKSLARIANESPNPILRVAEAGRLVFANRASRPLLEAWGCAVGDRLPADWVAEVDQALVDGETHERETVLAGQVYALLFTPIRELGYVNIYGRDITAVRRAEQEARQHQAELVHVCRLSTLGEVATGMAHELNQPLSAIANFANGASRRLQGDLIEPQPLIQAMGQITTQAERASEIIRRLRALVAKQPPIRSAADLNAMVREVCSFVEFDVERLGIALHLEMAPGRILVNVDLVQIEQVLLNLVRNALDALADMPAAERRIAIRTRVTPDEAEVEIEDNGPGIEPTQMRRLFEPFYTTKDSGMGMGLPISRTILDDHDGRIWAESQPGAGTTFHVVLPVIATAERTTDSAT